MTIPSMTVALLLPDVLPRFSVIFFPVKGVLDDVMQTGTVMHEVSIVAANIAGMIAILIFFIINSLYD